MWFIHVRHITCRCSTNRLEALVEIYRMMRPGEPPTKDAAETFSITYSLHQSVMTYLTVGRMKFNRRVGEC